MRKNRNLTVAQVACALKIAPSNYTRLESLTYSKSIRIDTIYKIAEVFNCSGHRILQLAEILQKKDEENFLADIEKRGDEIYANARNNS
jgi:transcriptional regulator with XRE-family HTH domain